jgi:hypothetical protein
VKYSSIVSFLRDIWPFDTLCINTAKNICNYVRWDVRDLAYFMYLHSKSVTLEPFVALVSEGDVLLTQVTIRNLRNSGSTRQQQHNCILKRIRHIMCRMIARVFAS